jgi:hypothetical protein
MRLRIMGIIMLERGLCLGGSRGRWLSRRGREWYKVHGNTIYFSKLFEKRQIRVGHHLRFGDGRRNLKKSRTLGHSILHERDYLSTSQNTIRNRHFYEHQLMLDLQCRYDATSHIIVSCINYQQSINYQKQASQTIVLPEEAFSP